MKGSRKIAPSKEYSDWLALPQDNWTPTYPFPAKVRAAVVTSLFEEQRGLCIYCGRKLSLETSGRTYHIEHFRPQKTYSHLAIKHHNIFLSCGQKTDDGRLSPTCGTPKENWFDEKNHIEPTYDDCTKRFKFLLSGNVRPTNTDDQAALEMISRLNLDHPELVKTRKDLLALVDSEILGLEEFFDVSNGQAESFAHVVFQHLGHKIP